MAKKSLKSKSDKPKFRTVNPALSGRKSGVKPELPGGFRDYGPTDAILRQRLFSKIRNTFEVFGFEPMETPGIERTKILLGGEAESDKVIFRVTTSRGSETKDIKKEELSLRFDLTIPLARFIAANPEIPKPFKRYQIGKVWRGESPQQGRYREFTQADIDIVGSSSMDADAEIIAVISAVLKNLGINSFIIKINNRKILEALPRFCGFPQKKLISLLRLIDKKEKVGEQKTQKEILKIFKKKAAEKIFQFLEISGNKKEKLIQVRKLLKKDTAAEEGIRELIDIVNGLEVLGVESQNWDIDFSMVRGLGYYTGPIFETILSSASSLGSIFSGGRYDNLVSTFTGEKLPAVGASLGVDRFLAALDSLGLLKKKPTTVKVLILNLDPELKNEYFSFARMLRETNINTALYLGDDRAFQAQLAYAVKKEIPYVLIYGAEEKKKNVVTIKNLSTREQKEISKEKVVEFFRK